MEDAIVDKILDLVRKGSFNEEQQKMFWINLMKRDDDDNNTDNSDSTSISSSESSSQRVRNSSLDQSLKIHPQAVTTSPCLRRSKSLPLISSFDLESNDY